jgi:pyruvate/2-oxoacid:ferredoxin oxidoreductase beta subunit
VAAVPLQPGLIREGKNPFKLDSKPPKILVKDFVMTETRFNMLFKSKPDEAATLPEPRAGSGEDALQILRAS